MLKEKIELTFEIGSSAWLKFWPGVKVKIIKYNPDDKSYLCEESDMERSWIDRSYITSKRPELKFAYSVGDTLYYRDKCYGMRYNREVKIIDRKANKGNYMYLCEFEDEERKWYEQEYLGAEKEC